MKPANEAFKIAEKSFLGTNYETPTVFSVEERNQLIRDYIKEYGEFSCYDDGGVPLNSNGTTIYVNKKNGAPDTFYIPSTYTWFGQTDWNGVVSAAQGIDLGINCEDGSDTPPGGGAGRVDDATEIDADDKPCFNGAGALGWIVCPVIKFLRLTLETIYENIVVPFLQINAKTFSNENGGVVAGWQAFQGFANLAFVALLLIVIFSQVTGVGIDNLGIKRILPKLIIAAILINLSYIICQLLVDASNIAGYGLRSLFDSIQVGETNITGTGQTIMNTALTAAVTAMAGYGAAATASIWAPFLILPFLLALVGMLISVLFMFILLGVRQAGVIILVVISPLAFAMYMLPNTKPLFQRWWKAFTGLLLLFPICGAMIGGADLAGKILASTSSEFWPNLIAALLTVVPFFFIPTLLKGSFSALGNLGAKISGVGARVGSGIGKVARFGAENSGWYKNIQSNAKDRREFQDANRENERAQRIVSRLRARQANGESLSGRDRDMLARYQKRLVGIQKEQAEIDRLAKPEYAEAAYSQVQSEAREKEIGSHLETIKSSDWFMGEDFSHGGSMYNNAMNILRTGSGEQIAAMTRALSTNDHTRDVLRDVVSDYTAGGVNTDSQRSAMEAVAREIKSDGKWKSEYDRRMFNWAADGNGSSSLADYNYGGTNGGSLTDKLTQSYMVSADDKAMEAMAADAQRIQAAIASGQNVSSSDAKALEAYQSVAYKTLHSDAASNMKVERQDALKSIVGNYTPPEVLHVRQQQMDDQAEAQASARYHGISDTEIEKMINDKRVRKGERLRAEAEKNRRSSKGNWNP